MNKEYTPTIGLEIHAELKTKTKMFCCSPNNPDEQKPNINICPVCMGHPGTLPVINKEAVRHVLRVGIALGGSIADFSEFDRKNYFYPDIPKGYQISQYKHPLVSGGCLKGIAITRVHLEEDTGTSIHKEEQHSLLDFNRAGVPLMELVTEPVIHNAKDAANFARELQLLLKTLDASDANMEKGEMRVEANISVSQKSKGKSRKLGTKVEVKNLNSFKAVEKAVEYEIKRQISILESGKSVVQETRGWNEAKGHTFSQRQKEESHDYRYFPEPDLPKLKISKIKEFSVENLKKGLPELPSDRRKRYKNIGIKEKDAEVLVSDSVLGNFFDETLSILGTDRNSVITAANYIISDISGLRTANKKRELEKITVNSFSDLVKMIATGEISSRGAKDILLEMFTNGGAPRSIAEQKGLLQQNDYESLKKIVASVIEKNSKTADDFKNGKTAVLQFLVGQCMRESNGAGNPVQFQKILRELL
jgi:aspartyl-tRNA(Asn)/glutamyl-tRNA(Gln) amidotransferase subunit B